MSSTLRSLYENLTVTGILYGWRFDAILLGGFVWAVCSGARQLRQAF